MRGITGDRSRRRCRSRSRQADVEQLVVREAGPRSGERFGSASCLRACVAGSYYAVPVSGSNPSREVCMKVQAAICWEPRRPLEIDEIELDGPQGGRVPRAARGDGRVPHRRLHDERARPVGAVPGRAGPRGRGRGRGGRARRHVARRRRPRDPALHPRVPQLQVLPVAQDEPLRRDSSRRRGKG